MIRVLMSVELQVECLPPRIERERESRLFRAASLRRHPLRLEPGHSILSPLVHLIWAEIASQDVHYANLPYSNVSSADTTLQGWVCVVSPGDMSAETIAYHCLNLSITERDQIEVPSDGSSVEICQGAKVLFLLMLAMEIWERR